MATKRTGKSTQTALAQQLIAGTNKHFANASSLAFASATYTPAQVVTSLQRLVTLRADVDSAKAVTQAKLADERAQAPSLRSFMAAFVSFVRTTFSNSPDVLADFGVHPKARTPLTVEQKAARAAKSKATRDARHTAGSKQKRAVKGTVVGITVTPISAPPLATPVPVPRADAPPAGAPAASPPHNA
jgi:hypothetical protein